MRVPFHDPGRVYRELAPSVNEAISRVLESGWYLMGTETAQFEQAFAELTGTKHCIAVANGTDALEIALRALGITADDEVVTVANAGGYATTAIMAVGASPVFVDVDSSTLTINIPAAAEAISAGTKAVVATHLYGYAVDVPALRSMLVAIGRADIAIVEDCAQAHGARFGTLPVGSMGDISCFSFYPTKNLGTFGDAGAIVTNDDALADRVTRLHQYGWGGRYISELPNGRNSRMDEIHAAILRLFLSHLEGWNARRCSIIRTYAEAAPPGVTLVHAGAAESRFVGHLAIARTPHRASISGALKLAGVATAVHYPVLDTEASWMSGTKHRTHDLRVSANARDEILTLPCFPGLTDREVDYVCEQLHNSLG